MQMLGSDESGSECDRLSQGRSDRRADADSVDASTDHLGFSSGDAVRKTAAKSLTNFLHAELNQHRIGYVLRGGDIDS